MNVCFELFRDPNKRLPFGNRQDGSMPGETWFWNAKCRDGFLTAIMQTWRLHPGKLTWNPIKREGRLFSFSIGWLLASMLIFSGCKLIFWKLCLYFHGFGRNRYCLLSSMVYPDYFGTSSSHLKKRKPVNDIDVKLVGWENSRPKVNQY